MPTPLMDSSPDRFERIVTDLQMSSLYELVNQIAPSKLAVLILGETGVGKEIVASAVHESSPRATRPFLRLNCASLADALLESELFGYEAGAFTGAAGRKPGLLETANGGTVFLDEVAELSHTVQSKLLRVVETQQITRIGGHRPFSIDVRFVSATNRDLLAKAQRHEFREDLYYRLAGFTVTVPPLRERRGEIAALADLFLAQARTAGCTRARALSPEARRRLENHAWPGNVRELKNVITRAALLCKEDVVGPELVLLDGRVAVGPTQPLQGQQGDRILRQSRLPFQYIGDARCRIADALAATGGNQTRAAEILRISRRSLVRLLTELDFHRPRKSRLVAPLGRG
jgi:two-component system response regulator AtoC